MKNEVAGYERFVTNDGIKVSVPVDDVIVPCAKCFEDCALGEFEILDGSSVCEDCFKLTSDYQDYLNSPLDPRD